MFFTQDKIARQLPELRAAIYRATYPIHKCKFFQGDVPGAERADFDDRRWADFTMGDAWGGYDVIAWFRARVPIPDGARHSKLALRLVVGPRDGGESTAESLLYVNGTPLQGLDVWHEEAWIPPEHLEKEELVVALRAWSGVIGVPERRRFKLAQLVSIDQDAECLYYLADTVLQAVRVLDENDLRRTRLLQALDEAFLELDWSEPGSTAFYQSTARASLLLQEHLTALRETDVCKPRVIAVGQAHLDMAWLWRLERTREKAARTFSTALHLMRQYPGYRFLHTSPQLFQFLKQDYPQVYEQIKERIASGDWDINGGMWVEADTNISGGESLVRQIIYGKRFTREEFGKETRVLWMPDVFGYSAALPQIMRQGELDYIMTTKISWNQFNRFPYDTFRWRGIDGSEVLAHYVTTPSPDASYYTYNGELTPFTVKGIWDHYQQKAINDELLLCFGAGDGGGGPTKETLEAAQIMQNLPGLPALELGDAESFFERLGERVANKQVPVWDGELYLEYHRGTYTSQAANKRANRQAEILFHNAEFFSTLSNVLSKQDDYPSQALRQGWEKILLNQFHDILPGSSIRQVYEDSQRDYEEVHRIGTRASKAAQAAILDKLNLAGPSAVVFNTIGCRRPALIELPWSEAFADKTIVHPDGVRSASQVIYENGVKKVLWYAPEVPALGYRAFPLIDQGKAKDIPEPMTIRPNRLENRYYRIELDERAHITSLFDKINQRQVLAAGERGNVLQVFEDKPMAFDAWDIDIYYQDKMREVDELIEAVVEEAGPLRGVLRLQWRFHNSVITQRVTIYQHSPRIDFRTEVDWQEKQQLLKVAFPVSVRSTHATYDIQFGNIERPTHWNTSWDYARFEVVGQKWADLSEGNYGVGLLNDCKYGYDIKGHVLRLTLIKSAVHPDALADQGEHTFTYSLLPHAGDWRVGRVVEEAYALNYPVQAHWMPAAQTGVLAGEHELAHADTDGVIIETVKQAEDGDGWIIRIYESKQYRHSQVEITFGPELRRAVECNLLERDERPVDFSAHRLTFPLAPFEIKTFKVWFSNS